MLATVPQMVSLPAATQAVYRAEVRIARKFDHARSFAIRCHFTDVHGTAPRRGRITTCSFRSYRHAGQRGQITHLQLRVRVVVRVADQTFEDGSGTVALPIQPSDPTPTRRSLTLDPS